MNWFKDTFLPSLEKRMNNPKYPNSCILSQKQADVCYRYMKCKQHKGDYGTFATYEYETEKALFQMSFAGKYTFLKKRIK